MKRSKLLAVLLCGAMFGIFGVQTTASAQGCGGYTGVPCSTTTTGSTPTDSTTTTGDEIPTVTVVRGETVDVSGSGCAPGETVTVTYDDGTALGTFTADDNGDFVTTITIPAGSTLGEHLVTATCGDLQQFLRVNVLGESVDAPGVNTGALPRTGSSNTGPLVGIGAAALVLGAAFLYGSRRPRTTD